MIHHHVDVWGGGLPSGSVVNLSVMQEMQVRSLGRKDALEEGMATHCSIFAWRIPMDRGAWRAAVQGVAKSQTRLKRLSMHTRGWDTALVASFLPQMQSLICKTKP